MKLLAVVSAENGNKTLQLR